jgi:hypothetical protein
MIPFSRNQFESDHGMVFYESISNRFVKGSVESFKRSYGSVFSASEEPMFLPL